MDAEFFTNKENILQAIFDNSLNAMMVADDNGNYLLVNQAAANMFGYTIEELLRMNVKDIHTQPEHADSAQLYRQYLSRGKEIGEFAFIHRDQTPRVAMYHAIRICSNINLSILEDVTEKKRAVETLEETQKALEKTTERLQLSTSAASIGIWDYDPVKNQLIWDETMFRLYGISPQDFPATIEAWFHRIHPEDNPFIQAQTFEWIKDKSEIDTEFRITLPDESIRYIRSKGISYRDESGKISRMVGTNWDITKEKEAEAQKIRARQLEVKNRELEQFAYVASHDLREPLRSIMSFAGLLKMRYANQLDAEAGEYLEFIYQAGGRMEKLIRGLLEYAHIGIEKQREMIDCNVWVDNVIHDLSSLISQTNATIEIQKLPVVQGYSAELHTLFLNLISNGLKYHKEGIAPHIVISAKTDAKNHTFCIEDNGIGIDAQYHEKIFVIFQRIHLNNFYEGAGIGLAHCQKIVELHGGKIWVESEPGKGSRFYFTLEAD
ncbi:MAG: PAS domain-containing protein [Bacteroidia bacterium]